MRQVGEQLLSAQLDSVEAAHALREGVFEDVFLANTRYIDHCVSDDSAVFLVSMQDLHVQQNSYRKRRIMDFGGQAIILVYGQD